MFVFRRLAKSIEPGQFWITCHPNGKESRGVHVLVRRAPNGNHIIEGGAKGRLNGKVLENICDHFVPKNAREHAESQKREFLKAKERVRQEKKSPIGKFSLRNLMNRARTIEQIYNGRGQQFPPSLKKKIVSLKKRIAARTISKEEIDQISEEVNRAGRKILGVKERKRRKSNA